MWLAAESGELDPALITAIWAFLGILVTTLGTIAVQSIKGRNDNSSSTAAPTPPSNGNVSALMQLATQQGQLVERADDNDDRDDYQDRRLARIEAWIEQTDPGWRPR